MNQPLLDTQFTSWSREDTMEYLSANPLPKAFTWRHRDGHVAVVQPVYAVDHYGKWLRETPYFRGLFELVHDTIVRAGAKLPDIDTIARELEEHRARDPQRNQF